MSVVSAYLIGFKKTNIWLNKIYVILLRAEQTIILPITKTYAV